MRKILYDVIFDALNIFSSNAFQTQIEVWKPNPSTSVCTKVRFNLVSLKRAVKPQT